MVKQKSQRLVLNKSHPLATQLVQAYLFTDGGGLKFWDRAQQPIYSASYQVGWQGYGLVGANGHQVWATVRLAGVCMAMGRLAPA